MASEDAKAWAVPALTCAFGTSGDRLCPFELHRGRPLTRELSFEDAKVERRLRMTIWCFLKARMPIKRATYPCIHCIPALPFDIRICPPRPRLNMPEDSSSNKRRRVLLGTAIALQSIFLGRCLSSSFPFDPRHMEVYTYGFWTMVLFGLAASRQTNLIRLIQPQWPIHISPRDAAILTNPGISARTQPDGSARGVFVDLAVSIVVTKPRVELKKRSAGDCPPKSFAARTLEWLFTNQLPKFPSLEPSFLKVWGLLAPLLLELKRGPPRHARNLFIFYKYLCRLLELAKRQAEKQALTLYGSGRYRYQTRLFAIAGAGDYFYMAEITRSWAESQNAPDDDDDGNEDEASVEDDSPPSLPQPGGQASPRDEAMRKLQKYEGCRPSEIAKHRETIDKLWNIVVEEVKNDDQYSQDGTRLSLLSALATLRSTAKQAETTFLDAAQRLEDFENAEDPHRRSGRLHEQEKKKLKDARNAARSAFVRAASALADQVAPIQEDTLVPFLEDDIELYHRSKQPEDTGTSFYETLSPAEFFSSQVQADGELKWSGVLRLGTSLADQYLEFANKYVEQLEDEEMKRRRNVRFPA
uniref:Uncharacterized protein n=1 Tax=Mycena chlorophos TaxID=658473 RepID=A0ABQ0L5X2_MYCCL|nr:predicted protein [Mycena chlorophos]